MRINAIIIVLFWSVFILTGSMTMHAQSSFMEKLELDISFGTSGLSADDIDTRFASLDRQVTQYSSQYGLTYTSTGSHDEISRLNPFNISINYRLSEKFFLKAGIDFGSSSGSGSKTFQVNWPELTENHNYAITDKISLVMPHIGGGYRAGNFDLYGAVGLGTVTLTYTEDVAYSEPGYSFDINRDYDVDGSSVGLIIGAKFRVKLAKLSEKRSAYGFIKVEAMLLNIGELKGTRRESGSSSDGTTHSNTVTGTVYSYELSPYQTGSFTTWDLHAMEPQGSGYNSVSKLSLNMSTIRLMLGISF